MSEHPPHPAIPWPGFTPAGALLLPLLAERMAAPFGAICGIDGRRLKRKREFHMTLLDRSQGTAAARGRDRDDVRQLYETFQWTPRRTGRYALLHQRKPDDPQPMESWSLIEHMELPAMLAFRAELARLLGPLFANPVPHVTHYVYGDPDGIAVPDQAALQACRVRDVPAPA